MGVDVKITPGTSRFDPDDHDWRDQVAALYTTLRENAAAVSVVGVSVPEAKGTLDTAVIALGSSGVFTAAVACFRAWLTRDKTRTLTITWTDDSGTEQRIALTGDNIDQASLQSFAKSIGKRLGSD
jgi:Effector Associated Constant Component 1